MSEREPGGPPPEEMDHTGQFEQAERVFEEPAGFFMDQESQPYRDELVDRLTTGRSVEMKTDTKVLLESVEAEIGNLYDLRTVDLFASLLERYVQQGLFDETTRDLVAEFILVDQGFQFDHLKPLFSKIEQYDPIYKKHVADFLLTFEQALEDMRPDEYRQIADLFPPS